MGDVAVVYHWWSDVPIEKTFRCPILCSIATLRQHNPDISVYVLDVTENSQHDWKVWEKKLNFKTMKWLPYLKTLNFQNIDNYSLTEPSRHIDVYNLSKKIKENIIFYSDSDVFYVKPILPFVKPLQDKIVSPVFTAYFYFNKNKVKKFINFYRDLCVKCLTEQSFVKSLYQYCPYSVSGRRLWSEVITYYLSATNQDVEFIEKMDEHEFANINCAFRYNVLPQAKSLHLFYNGKSNYDEMDYVALFKEFREPVEKFLGADFVKNLKPDIQKTISLYDPKFISYMHKTIKTFKGTFGRQFIDKSLAFASDS